MAWNWRWTRIALIVVGCAMAADALILAAKWPFTKAKLIETLREQANGEVTIRSFRQTFFPTPGCVAEGITMHSGAREEQPLITIENLTVRGAYSSLLMFSKRLNEVDTVGMHIRVPADRGSVAKNGGSWDTVIGRFVAERSVLEFASRKQDGEPYVLQIHRTVLTPATSTAAMSFEASLAIPEPAGEVTASGSFGPWQAFRTNVSGHYEFRHADLGEFRGMKGILNSDGKFSGTVENIQVSGNIDVPNFEIAGTGHSLDLNTGFEASVGGRTGDVQLASVKSRFLHSEVDGAGAVASPVRGAPKTVSLQMSVNTGRIQDLLRLVTGGPPGLNGVVGLRYSVELPPGDKPFLERLRLTGVMGVAGARFTDPATQQGLEHISAKAVPEVTDPADTVSNVRGRVSTANGVATLSDVTFDVPGAKAQLSGTYQLLQHRLDLRGTVQLEEKLSQTTTGVKSFLLKALDPIFKRRKHLSIVPIRISGVAGNISIGLN